MPDAAHIPDEPTAPDEAGDRPRLRLRDWVFLLAFAMGAALFIRTFAFQAFRIPTPSMEKTLLVGDFVIVSKLAYGPRIPVTLGLPLTNLYYDGWEAAPRRLPGFGGIERDDVIVFNYPQETGPLDRKTHYIKRVIALPGDTLLIRDKVPYVDGLALAPSAGIQQKWLAHTHPGKPFPLGRLRELGAEQIITLSRNDRRISFEATQAVAAEVQGWVETDSLAPFVLPHEPGFSLRIFPYGSGFGRDQYGPLYVPARGDTLTLTDANWPAYARLLTRYEGLDVIPLGENRFEVDGEPLTTYVVQQDYFFVMGDNRDNSEDSRVWGFVPMDHVVGKATHVYFSWDQEQRRPRFGRLLHPIE